MSHQDASAEEEHNAPTTNDQEPPEDAREDAESLSANTAEHATYPSANNTTDKNIINYIFTLYFHILPDVTTKYFFV